MEHEATETKSLLGFSVSDMTGRGTDLHGYAGKVLLIVNVASKCGFTPQYTGLQQLYDRYRDKGFEVLGFPANNFLWQEPGTDEQIQSFCSLTYGVSFPMFSKVSVRGRDIHPLYAFLTDRRANPEFGGAVGWNFTKFLVDRGGRVVGRFEPKTEPLDPRLTGAVETALSAPGSP
jgi:glutathione peroxidase